MKKPIVKTLLSVLLVAVVLVGATLAYMVATDSPVLNTFKPADVTTDIEETGSTADDKTATVKNTGKSPVYVRAMVVISGGDANVGPENFSFTYASDWQDGGDGFYYYKTILQPQNSTSALFTGVTVDSNVPKEAKFSVDVYQESVLAPAEGGWSLEAAQAAFAAKG